MTSINATFDVPGYIEAGLEDGQYERVGGVIRETGTKSVVAWLRENHFRQPINFGSLLNSLVPFIGILNLGISVGGFTLVLGRLKSLESGLRDIEQKVAQIDKKIDFGNYANLASAIQQADSAFMMTNPRNREASATQAIDRLLVAGHYFSSLFDEKVKAQDAEGGHELLSTICLIHTTEILCYLELNEPEVALNRVLTLHKQLCGRRSDLCDWFITLYDAPFFHPYVLKTETTDVISRLYNIYIAFFGGIDLPSMVLLQNQKLLDRAGRYTDKREWTVLHSNVKRYLEIMEAQAEEARRFGAYSWEIGHIVDNGISWREWCNAKPKTSNPDADYFLILP